MAAVLLYVCSAFVVWAMLWPRYGAAQNYDDCPTSCACLGILIDCSERGLVEVPRDLHLRSWGTRLELQSNGITSLGDDDFKGLNMLEELYLSHNDITHINGSIFRPLVNLRTLRITHNKLTEMPVFPRHLNITEVSLAHNLIHTISPEALQALPNLQKLNLNHNQIMDIPIGAFPSPSHLTRLYLNNNKIMRLEPGCLDNLTTLEQLKLNKNEMFELRKEIFSALIHLKLLELSRNKISTIQGLTFSGLKNLQVLKLERNAIAALMDGAFWGLESITYLQLDFNHISNITSSWLFGLSSLRELSLTHNKIGVIQQDGWECCKHNLHTLDLTHNQLKVIFPTTFKKLVHLENLLLDHNKLSRIDQGAFDDLQDLVTLEMNDNAVAWTMEDMQGAFQGLRSLMKLGLKMNHIKSITNHAFTGLSRLRQLHLEDNNITTIQEFAFQPLQDLRELRLNSTNLLCDCNLAWLPGWLRMFGFQNSVTAVCSYPPTLQNRSIFSIPLDEFQCNEQEIPKPIILTNPESQNAYKGENMTLTCTAAITGEAEPTIHWKKDNEVLPDTKVENFANSDGDIKRYTSRLHLHTVQDQDAGHYQCVVSNQYGPAFSHRAKINVYVFPVFIKKPVDITVKAGQSAKLQCSATGQPQPVVISWQKDGGDDFPAARERRMYVIPKDDQFFIASTRSSDEGVYTCRAENEAGVVTANATVTILETPDFIRPMEEEKRTHIGETSVLECMASGSPRPKLQWFKDGQPLVITPRHFFTADNQLLIIVETTWDDDGTYTCEMSNTLGIMRDVTRLTVLSADGQSGGSGKSSSGLDDESTTTGIIIIAVVCCVVGTSLVWVIIIYQTRKRHEMYSATPTDETTLPGEVPSSGYSSSDKEGSYTQAPVGIATYHYQDYQLKESGYESSSGQYCPNGWSGMRPSAAIFPSDVEEDDTHRGHQMSLSQQDLQCHHQATSMASLQPSGEESDTMLSTQSGVSQNSCGGVAAESSVPQPLSRGGSTLSTFHPGPTNHDRCVSHPIALPSVCGETSMAAMSVTTVAATTQTPCPNCERCNDRKRPSEKEGAMRKRDRYEGCLMHQHRHCSGDTGANSDSNTYQQPVTPAIPPRASSCTSLRPVQGGCGRCSCQSAGCTKLRNGLLLRSAHPHRQTEVCSVECSGCDAVFPACTCHTCCHPVTECQQWKAEEHTCHIPGGTVSRDCRYCAQHRTDVAPYPSPTPHDPSSHHSHTSHSHIHRGGEDRGSHPNHSPHRHKDGPVNM
ncbi:uncharacterized protein LOC143284771 isoform X2 [Babylonia areolata]|uniref:uncharacterized protein LOC143284771 isoform X2 n=1 Tax=Babylonia areolata TaxID=304850 RepID=UPI003FCEE847